MIKFILLFVGAMMIGVTTYQILSGISVDVLLSITIYAVSAICIIGAFVIKND